MVICASSCAPWSQWMLGIPPSGRSTYCRAENETVREAGRGGDLSAVSSCRNNSDQLFSEPTEPSRKHLDTFSKLPLSYPVLMLSPVHLWEEPQLSRLVCNAEFTQRPNVFGLWAVFPFFFFFLALFKVLRPHCDLMCRRT